MARQGVALRTAAGAWLVRGATLRAGGGVALVGVALRAVGGVAKRKAWGVAGRGGALRVRSGRGWGGRGLDPPLGLLWGSRVVLERVVGAGAVHTPVDSWAAAVTTVCSGSPAGAGLPGRRLGLRSSPWKGRPERCTLVLSARRFLGQICNFTRSQRDERGRRRGP